MYSHSAETLNTSVFKVLHCRNSCGNPFQIRGLATEKRHPKVVAVRGMISRSVLLS